MYVHCYHCDVVELCSVLTLPCLVAWFEPIIIIVAIIISVWMSFRASCQSVCECCVDLYRVGEKLLHTGLEESGIIRNNNYNKS